jgi:hypothetical protein
MTSVYDVITTIKTFLRNHPIVNYVTYGDITQVDLNKTVMFPLTHFFIGNVAITEHAMRVTVSLLFLDIVDYTKDYNANDLGDRQDESNLIDVYNTQLQVANALVQDLRRGDLYRGEYQLVGNPVCEPFKDRFENELAGWSMDITIDIPNDISVC